MNGIVCGVKIDEIDGVMVVEKGGRALVIITTRATASALTIAAVGLGSHLACSKISIASTTNR